MSLRYKNVNRNCHTRYIMNPEYDSRPSFSTRLCVVTPRCNYGVRVITLCWSGKGPEGVFLAL